MSSQTTTGLKRNAGGNLIVRSSQRSTEAPPIDAVDSQSTKSGRLLKPTNKGALFAENLAKSKTKIAAKTKGQEAGLATTVNNTTGTKQPASFSKLLPETQPPATTPKKLRLDVLLPRKLPFEDLENQESQDMFPDTQVPSTAPPRLQIPHMIAQQPMNSIQQPCKPEQQNIKTNQGLGAGVSRMQFSCDKFFNSAAGKELLENAFLNVLTKHSVLQKLSTVVTAAMPPMDIVTQLQDDFLPKMVEKFMEKIEELKSVLENVPPAAPERSPVVSTYARDDEIETFATMTLKNGEEITLQFQRSEVSRINQTDNARAFAKEFLEVYYKTDRNLLMRSYLAPPKSDKSKVPLNPKVKEILIYLIVHKLLGLSKTDKKYSTTLPILEKNATEGITKALYAIHGPAKKRDKPAETVVVPETRAEDDDETRSSFHDDRSNDSSTSLISRASYSDIHSQSGFAYLQQ